MNPRPFTQIRFDRAKDLSLCLRCVVLFVDPKNEEILLESHDNIAEYLAKHKLVPMATAAGIADTFAAKPDNICPCCMGFLCPAVLNQICVKLLRTMQASLLPLPGEIFHSINLVLDFPVTFDVMRICVRTILTRVPEKTDPFPSFSELLHRLIGVLLKRLGNVSVVGEERSKNKVVLTMRLFKEGDMCRLMCPWCFDFFKRCGGKDKSLKRTAEEMDAIEDSSDLFSSSNEAMPRRFLDEIIIELKGMAHDKGLLELQHRINGFYCAANVENMEFAKIDIVATKSPTYLLGRYRKLSRDVPQSRWDVDAKVAEGIDCKPSASDCDLMDTGELKRDEEGGPRVRKGRNSVEEIILDSIATVLEINVSNLKMHGCGREDIDVRMLGNGRPFVVECLNLKKGLSSDIINEALLRIARGGGLNGNFDVEVTWLAEVPRGVWEGMQTVAEEKCKAYCCVVWCENVIEADVLNAKLSTLPLQSGSADEEGISCLEIEQLTPLRVLHRRSLLKRKRYIYSMSAVPLNSNYFLLQVVTSAGTYVKEFVHGDFGRSEPSVASILGCRADITQLDVTWLYDDFGDVNWNRKCAALACNPAVDSLEGASASLMHSCGQPECVKDMTVALRSVLEAGVGMSWEGLRALTSQSGRVYYKNKNK